MSKLAIFIIVLVYASCSPAYHYIEDTTYLLSLDEKERNAIKLDTYSFKLEPYFHFKNNVSTQSLFSSHSDFIRDKKLFTFKNQERIFDDPKLTYINNSAFQIDIMLPSEEEWVADAPVFVKSYTYKKCKNGERLVRYMHVFSGRVGECMDPTANHALRQIHLDKFYKFTGKKMKDKSSSMGKITLLVSDEAINERIRVYAIIASKYEGRETEIFDLRSTFGSEIWLNREEGE